MKRLVLHWTGGGTLPNEHELECYHALVDQHARRHFGKYAPEANLNISDGIYARHAGGFNTGAIGLGMCGMLGARESPFDPGNYPIKKSQYLEACKWSAELLISYDLKVSRDTCMLHSEVLPRYGRGVYKWDVNWLPGMIKPGDPIKMGDAYRDRVSFEYKEFMAKRPKVHPIRGWRRLLS